MRVRFDSPGHRERCFSAKHKQNSFHIAGFDFHQHACLLQWGFAVNEAAVRFANRLFSSEWRRLLCRDASSYTQGQSPEARIREYFYYIDHQGQLFLDNTKVKNFVTCFKDQHFLVFFFSRLKVNQSGRYQQDFPFLSLCGRERNFLRCEDRPVVFTHLLSEAGHEKRLSYCGGGAKLTVPFRPESLFMHPVSGRVYHPGPEQGGGVGLVRSVLAIELSSHFEYRTGQESTGQPTHFIWAGHQHILTNELAKHFPVHKDQCVKLQ